MSNPTLLAQTRAFVRDHYPCAVYDDVAIQLAVTLTEGGATIQECSRLAWHLSRTQRGAALAHPVQVEDGLRRAVMLDVDNLHPGA